MKAWTEPKLKPECPSCHGPSRMGLWGLPRVCAGCFERASEQRRRLARFQVNVRPTAMRPTHEVVDTEREPRLVLVGEIEQYEVAAWVAAQMNQTAASGDLPPAFDLPGDPSESPF